MPVRLRQATELQLWQHDGKRMTTPQQCSNCGKQGKLLQCSRCKTQSYCSTNCQTLAWPAHRPHCRPPNYVLKIDLHPGQITNPPISRTISCPARASFADLHTALQIAFGWSSIHTFDFKIRDPNAPPSPTPSLEEYMQNIMTEEEVLSPSGSNEASSSSSKSSGKEKERENSKGKTHKKSKRGGQVPLGPRQNLLRIIDTKSSGHELLQHTSRSHPSTPEVTASKTSLQKVLSDPDYAGAPIEYEYDFGDRWIHTIRILGRALTVPSETRSGTEVELQERFICTAGSGHGVAEDIGGVEGWNKLKDAYRGVRPNADQRDRIYWFEQLARNADPKGLGGGRETWWDQAGVNWQLERI